MPSEMIREMFFGKLIDKGVHMAHVWNKKDKPAIAKKALHYRQIENWILSIRKNVLLEIGDGETADVNTGNCFKRNIYRVRNEQAKK